MKGNKDLCQRLPTGCQRSEASCLWMNKKQGFSGWRRQNVRPKGMVINWECAGQIGCIGEIQTTNMFCLDQATLACMRARVCMCVFK